MRLQQFHKGGFSGEDFWGSNSTIDVVHQQRRRDSNPRRLSAKCERFLCAVPSSHLLRERECVWVCERERERERETERKTLNQNQATISR